MATISIQVERIHLRAALIFASENDIRAYLNGVCVEAFSDRCFLVATDGRRMAVLRDNLPESCLPADETTPVRFIVPRELLDKIKANVHDSKISISYDTESCAVTVKDGITQSIKTACQGAYPDYRRAFPDKLSGVPEQIAPESASDLGKIARILGCRNSSSVLIFHNGPVQPTDVSGGNVVEIEGHPEFLGLVMGNRDVRRSPCIDTTKFLARTAAEESPPRPAFGARQGDETINDAPPATHQPATEQTLAVA